MSELVQGGDGLWRPAWAASDPLLRTYYDQEWGMPVTDEKGVYERISLESFQSGLSWATILKKRENFRRVFADFDPDIVAGYSEAEIEVLVNDPRIIRNRAKINSVIKGAQATIMLRADGGLADFVWSFKPATTPTPQTIADCPTRSTESAALAAALKQRGFSFVGPTSAYALMAAIGMVDLHLVGSHRRGCSGLWPV